MEKAIKEDPHPEYVANKDVSDVNLEHILPLTPGDNWDVDFETAKATQRLLGNMVLLRSSKNRDLGNSSFSEKTAVYNDSGYYLTKEVAQYDEWTLNEIRNRQAEMAKLAVRTWTLSLTK